VHAEGGRVAKAVGALVEAEVEVAAIAVEGHWASVETQAPTVQPAMGWQAVEAVMGASAEEQAHGQRALSSWWPASTARP
jgi:hypothetical protein